MYAVTPRGVGEEPGVRRIRPDWVGSGIEGKDLKPGEFVVEDFPDGLVTGEDGRSLRAPTPQERNQERAARAREEARSGRVRATPSTYEQLDAIVQWADQIEARREALRAATTVEELRDALEPLVSPPRALMGLIDQWAAARASNPIQE